MKDQCNQSQAGKPASPVRSQTGKKLRPVVFLDRDGTLNEEIGYIRNLDDLKLIAGAGEAVSKLNQEGIAAILVTNQTGAARGYYGEDHIVALNQKLEDLLSTVGAHLDASYYCPHLDQAQIEAYAIDCNCRKPKTAMVERAYQEDATLDVSHSYVVGDKATDVELAKNCGAKGVLVLSGYGQDVMDGKYQWAVKPDFIARDIGEGINWILQDLKASSDR
jgi:D-glycero-D-manno-heptose 1,7-bisphosphate phosphatase